MTMGPPPPPSIQIPLHCSGRDCVRAAVNAKGGVDCRRTGPWRKRPRTSSYVILILLRERKEKKRTNKKKEKISSSPLLSLFCLCCIFSLLCLFVNLAVAHPYSHICRRCCSDPVGCQTGSNSRTGRRLHVIVPIISPPVFCVCRVFLGFRHFFSGVFLLFWL